MQCGGVVNPKTDFRANKKAERLYEEIRNRNYDLLTIGKRTNFPVEIISIIKNYIFNDKHILQNGKYERFHSDYRIAESWRRLSTGKDNKIELHDVLLLLYHEACEISYLMNNHCSVTIAHEYAQERYNYAEASDQYYDKIFGSKQNTDNTPEAKATSLKIWK